LENNACEQDNKKQIVIWQTYPVGISKSEAADCFRCFGVTIQGDDMSDSCLFVFFSGV